MFILSPNYFEEKAEKQDQHDLRLNRDRDRLQKYWAISTTSKIFTNSASKSYKSLQIEMLDKVSH